MTDASNSNNQESTTVTPAEGEVKKPRKLSPEQLLKLSGVGAKISATEFIQKHRDRILELDAITERAEEVLLSFDAKEVLATPARSLLQSLIYEVVCDEAALKAQKSLDRAKEGKSSGGRAPAEPKAYQCAVHDQFGNVITYIAIDADGKPQVKEMRAQFDLYQRAREWCQRRLVERSNTDCGLITAIKEPPFKEDGVTANPFYERFITRAEACHDQWTESSRRPFMKRESKGTGALSFGVKSKPTRNVKCSMG